MTISYKVVTWTRPLLFTSTSTRFSITESTINILEIARKQLQKYRATPWTTPAKSFKQHTQFLDPLLTIGYTNVRVVLTEHCFYRQLTTFSKNEEWHAGKGIVIVYGPSPVKSQKFLPAVNHTKLRIDMFTPELLEKSTCNLV